MSSKVVFQVKASYPSKEAKHYELNHVLLVFLHLNFVIVVMNVNIINTLTRQFSKTNFQTLDDSFNDADNCFIYT